LNKKEQHTNINIIQFKLISKQKWPWVCTNNNNNSKNNNSNRSI